MKTIFKYLLVILVSVSSNPDRCLADEGSTTIEVAFKKLYLSLQMRKVMNKDRILLTGTKTLKSPHGMSIQPDGEIDFQINEKNNQPVIFLSTECQLIAADSELRLTNCTLCERNGQVAYSRYSMDGQLDAEQCDSKPKAEIQNVTFSLHSLPNVKRSIEFYGKLMTLVQETKATESIGQRKIEIVMDQETLEVTGIRYQEVESFPSSSMYVPTTTYTLIRNK
jgi:hypothetical protein